MEGSQECELLPLMANTTTSAAQRLTCEEDEKWIEVMMMLLGIRSKITYLGVNGLRGMGKDEQSEVLRETNISELAHAALIVLLYCGC